MDDSNSVQQEKILDLKSLLKASTHTTILTGAGMSTESGIPDFRSRSGWWKNIDPLTVATVDALEHNYALFHDFYKMRLITLETTAPHEGHYTLSKWEEKNLINDIATQNVDGLHRTAGSNKIHELHGSIETFRCHTCHSRATKAQFLDKKACHQCNGKLRPNVVLFGETLPQAAWNKALLSIEKADLVIVIGTSLQVYPVNQLPFMTKGHTVLINKELSSTHHFELAIEGGAKQVLTRIDNVL
ncbi:NAD-dependent deacylase [Evansella sp. AB-P1]|uniref:SIR2 family NAD-dependent protein deacylase n=1 Tax=Evansella sp. AB-P1 TaxID=3037653 RepID=UPI00241DAA18|nr:NAD-dependent deacylase [Evansella sp. AB-P1]MDG5787261.1 NAD-dependent deacylase [Evansella sp. AB-P1]